MTGRRRATVWSGPLAIAVLLLAAPTSLRAQPGDPPQTRHATLRVDTSQVGDAGPVIKRRVEERGGVVLRDAQILPARDGRDAVVSVTVQELRGEDPGFVFEMWVERAGVLLGERRRVECTLCTESEIVARIEEALVDATSEVQPDSEIPAEGDDGGARQGGPEGDEPGDIDPESGDETDNGGRRGLGAKGKAGIALIAMGGAGVAVGLGLTLAEPRVHRDDPLMETDTRDPGIGVLVGAGVAVITGAVLLGIDRRAAKRRTAWAPWLGPAGAGLTVVGRF